MKFADVQRRLNALRETERLTKLNGRLYTV